MTVETRGFIPFIADYFVYCAVLYCVQFLAAFCTFVIAKAWGVDYDIVSEKQSGEMRTLLDQVVVIIFMFKYR